MLCTRGEKRDFIDECEFLVRIAGKCVAGAGDECIEGAGDECVAGAGDEY